MSYICSHSLWLYMLGICLCAYTKMCEQASIYLCASAFMWRACLHLFVCACVRVCVHLHRLACCVILCWACPCPGLCIVASVDAISEVSANCMPCDVIYSEGNSSICPYSCNMPACSICISQLSSNCCVTYLCMYVCAQMQWDRLALYI